MPIIRAKKPSDLKYDFELDKNVHPSAIVEKATERMARVSLD